MFGDFGDGVLLFYPHYPELWKPMNIIMILSRNRYSSTILGCVPMFFHETMKPEVVSNFRPTKNNFNCSTIKKYSWKFSPKLPWKKKSGSFPSRNSSPARPAQRYLPFQAMDVIEVSGSACAWWSAGTMREGLPEGMPRLQVRMGKHWENIGKTLENIRKLEKHWKNSGDLKQVVVRSLGYHWKKSLG